MTGFFVGVMIAAIKALLGDKTFTDWADARLDKLATRFEATVKDEIGSVETNLISKLEELPLKIVGDANKDVQTLVNGLDGSFKGALSPLSSALQSVQGILNNLPHFPGFGG